VVSHPAGHPVTVNAPDGKPAQVFRAIATGLLTKLKI